MRVEILAETESIWAKDGKSKRDNKKKTPRFKFYMQAFLFHVEDIKKSSDKLEIM